MHKSSEFIAIICLTLMRYKFPRSLDVAFCIKLKGLQVAFRELMPQIQLLYIDTWVMETPAGLRD